MEKKQVSIEALLKNNFGDVKRGFNLLKKNFNRQAIANFYPK